MEPAEDQRELNRLRRGIREIFAESGVNDPELVEILARSLCEYETTGSYARWSPSLEFYEQPH